MGIHPTLLPVSPTARVRPAFFQSHLHPLPVFLVCPFLSPLPFLSFPLSNCLSQFQLIFLFLCPWSQPSTLLMSLPYNFPPEFPTVPSALILLLCPPHTPLSSLLCLLIVSSWLLSSPRLTMFILSIYLYLYIHSVIFPSVCPSIHIYSCIHLSIHHPFINIHFSSFIHALTLHPSTYIHPSIYPSIHHLFIHPSPIHPVIQHPPDPCFTPSLSVHSVSSTLVLPCSVSPCLSNLESQPFPLSPPACPLSSLESHPFPVFPPLLLPTALLLSNPAYRLLLATYARPPRGPGPPTPAWAKPTNTQGKPLHP